MMKSIFTLQSRSKLIRPLNSVINANACNNTQIDNKLNKMGTFKDEIKSRLVFNFSRFIQHIFTINSCIIKHIPAENNLSNVDIFDESILWAYAPKQKSLKGRTKRRELQYILYPRTDITYCNACGHPILFSFLCANCLRFIISRTYEYRKAYFTQERLDEWKKKWEYMLNAAWLSGKDIEDITPAKYNPYKDQLEISNKYRKLKKKEAKDARKEEIEIRKNQ